ncbi:MAG TPA: biofilm-associated protein [Nitrosopumilaceae archaeon]|nr:biofilm-associated protein [Nitrosopumilaceae archaeon]
MEAKTARSILLSVLLISSSFFTLVMPQAWGQTELVTVTSTSHQEITVVEYKNSEENVFDIKSVVLEVYNGKFKSFKTENGWTGKKTSVDTVTFTSTNPIKPGESAKFGIKTDKSEPVFGWKAFDDEGDELGSGGRIITTQQEIIKETKPVGPSAILDDSSFRMIPTTPSVGSSLRIIGDHFAPREKFDFYIDSRKIDSFVTNENGNFILSTKIPDDQQADRADFIIRDQNNNQKSTSLRIKESSSREIAPLDVSLTVNSDSIYHRGDEKTISGTATPDSTITMSISDSEGSILTTLTAKADSTGKYSITHRVPLDREFGDYIISISDGKSTVFHPYTVETTQKITLLPGKQPYQPGETIVVNGTALPNQEIQITIDDPVGMEVYANSFVVGADGKVAVEYKLDTAAREGTYVIFATQGKERETVLVGVGELPEVQLLVTMSALNYKTSDQVVINIIGPPSSTVNLIIVDPSDKQKFADTITIGPDGYLEYAFSANGYSPGVYTAVLTRGNAQVEERFSVGLGSESGPITITVVKDTYLAGDSILLLGKSKPNIIVTITLIDPDGVKIRTTEVFTKSRDGVFQSSVFRFPSDAKPGIWKIDAASGLNHVSKKLTVLTQSAQGLAVHVDKSPPAYSVGEIVTISGSGAGKSHNIQIKILSSDQTIIGELSIVAKSDGTYSTIWKVPTNFDAGTYTIKVLDATLSTETTFTVQ